MLHGIIIYLIRESKVHVHPVHHRYGCLAGEPSWIRNNLQVGTKPGNLIAHDWLLLAQSAAEYIFADKLSVEHDTVVMKLLHFIRRCLRTYGDVIRIEHDDDVIPADIGGLRVQIIEALVLAEKYLPRTEMTKMLHCLVHAPDTIYRWGSIRNTWAFWTERYPLHCIYSSSCTSISY